MLVLLDTNVLVAAFVASHPHHSAAMRWFQLAEKKKISIMVAAHSIAECYAVLTRLPLTPKISPADAYRILRDNSKKMGKLVSLDPHEYMDIAEDLSLLGLSGGIVYDAIILKTAQKHHAKKLITFNKKHFLQLSPDTDFIQSAAELMASFSE
ncbi:MAG: type II toxin-antitoxin system VapC family toxin [Gammaproteobacteria bacterium]